MSKRAWLVVIVIAVGVLGWFWYVMSPDSGDVEFQRAAEAMKSVRGWKFTEFPESDVVFRKGGSWEVDCATVQPRTTEAMWGTEDFYTPDFAGTCSAIAKGGSGYPFPDFSKLQAQSVINNRGTKKVNGVKCRQWQVQVVKIMRREDILICLGTKDHLPYEVSGESEPHLTFSDYITQK